MIRAEGKRTASGKEYESRHCDSQSFPNGNVLSLPGGSPTLGEQIAFPLFVAFDDVDFAGECSELADSHRQLDKLDNS